MNPSSPSSCDALFRALSRAILMATGVFLLLWFLNEALLAVLFIAVALILALALNPPDCVVRKARHRARVGCWCCSRCWASRWALAHW